VTDAGLSLGRYILGVAELAAILLPLAFAAVRVRRRFLPGWSGAPARLAEAILAIALVLWTAELVGLVGLFTDVAMVVASIAIGAAVGALAGTGRALLPGSVTSVPSAPAPAGSVTPVPKAPVPRPGNVPLVLAALACAGVAAAWAVPLGASYAGGIDGVDSMWYHLPQSARFVQTGSVVDLHFTDPYFLNWYYPANSELLHAVGMLVFDRDWLSPLLNHAFLALGLLAAWCIGRPWGLGPQALIGAAIVFGSEMMLDFQPGEARNDAIGLALFLAAIAFLVTLTHQGEGSDPSPRGVKGSDPLSGRRLDRWPEPKEGLTPFRWAGMGVAGLAAGLAVGTKLTMLAPVAALTVGVAVLAGRGERLRGAGIFLAGIVAGGGFWYVRNLVHSGNPLPWIDELGPVSLPAPEVALELRPDHSVAHYATDFDVWREWFGPGLEDGIGELWPLVLLLTVGAAIAAFVFRGGLSLWGQTPRGQTLAAVLPVLGGVVLVTLVAYLFTPLTASGPEGAPEGFVWNLRYIAPALGLGLVLLSLLPPLRGPRGRLATAVGLFAILAIQIALLQVWDFGQRNWAIASAVLVLAAFAAAWLLERRPLPRPALAAGAAVLAAVAIGAGYVEQDRYLDRRYADVLDGLRLDSPIAWANGVRDERIATAGRGGVFFQYGFYGPDLSNEVQWLGEPGARGAWLPIESCEPWRQAVNEGGFNYVVTTYDKRFPGSDDTSREREWIRRDPAATALLREGPVTVFGLSGALDPSGCGAREAAAADRPTGVPERED
jgi:hypothetical protein